MMFQVPVALGLFWLLVPTLAETEISGKETHQVYSYTYHFQHNGSTDPKQFIQSFLPDPPEGGSAVRTFFNPNLRGFISKGYLPSGPVNTFRTFPRSPPNLPTYEGIKNLVDENLRKNFQPPPPTPEFAPLLPTVEKNIADIRNDIHNSLFHDSRNNNLNNNVFPELHNPVIHNDISPHPPPVPALVAPIPPPPPPPPPPPHVPELPTSQLNNDGVIRNVRTFQKDLPNGKVFEKIETISYNPAPVSNFVSDTQKIDGGERRSQHFSNQNGYGFRSTSYFRKEHLSPTDNALNNNLEITNNNGGNNAPWKNNRDDNNDNNINQISGVGPLKLLIIPAFENINKITDNVNENLNAIEIPRPQNIQNQPNPGNNHRNPGGFGLRLRKPVIATLYNQQARLPISQPPANSNPHSPAVRPVQFHQQVTNHQNNNHQQPPRNHHHQQQNHHQQPQNHQHQPQNHHQQPQNHQKQPQNHHQQPQNHQQQPPKIQHSQSPNIPQQHPHQTPNFHQRPQNTQSHLKPQLPNSQQPLNQPRNPQTHQNNNNGVLNAFRNDFNKAPPNAPNHGQQRSHNDRNNNFNYNNNNAERIIHNVNNKLRGIDDQFNGISRTKPGSEAGGGGGPSRFFWDDGNDQDWDPFPKMEWGHRISQQGPRNLPVIQNDRPFSNGHSGPNRAQQIGSPNRDQGDTHTMDILRHTLEALVGRKLEIPVIPSGGNQQNSDGGSGTDYHNRGGFEKIFATDRIVEGPNSFSRNQQRGFERNFQVNSNTGYERANQWSTDTARRLDTQSSRDDFRRDYIDVFAEDV